MLKKMVLNDIINTLFSKLTFVLAAGGWLGALILNLGPIITGWVGNFLTDK